MANNAFQGSVGVTTEERVANSFSLGSDVSTKNIGLAVARKRGVAGQPILINSLKEDRKIFGGHDKNMYSSYMVETLLNNTGGYPVNLYQVRVVGAGSVASRTTVKNSGQNDQQFLTTTVQNASSTQRQTSYIEVKNVGVGDKFTYTLSGMHDVANIPTAYTHTATLTAVTDNEVDMLQLIRLDIVAFLSTLVGNFSTSTDTQVTSMSKLYVQGIEAIPFNLSGNATNDVVSEDILEIVAGRQGEEDKGSWGNNLRVRVYPIGNLNGSQDGYKMEVVHEGYLVESFVSVGNDWQTLIDRVNQNSEYVLINALDLTKELNLGVFDSALGGGVYVAPTETDFVPKYNAITGEAEGLAIFDGVDAQILACPEVFSASFVAFADAFARKNLRLFVFNMPYLATETVLQSYYNALSTPDQSFVAGYLNWIEVPADSEGNKIWVPAIGYVLGSAYIRKGGLHNGYVWIPPAGTETNAKGVYRITHDVVSDDTLSRYIKSWRCNVVKYIKNIGFCVWSSRTYSNNPLYESIHIRLETNWIIENLKIRNEKYLQRLISPSLFKEQRTDNLIWFKNIYEQGGIEQSVSFADAVVVTIEQSKENRKESEMEVAWIPPECNEHIHIKLSRNDGVLIINF